MDQIRKVLVALCNKVRTPRALAVKLLANAGEWTQLQQLKLRSPETYSSHGEYRKDAIVTELLRKCLINASDSERTRAKAVATFWECETQCAATNARLNRFLPDQSVFDCPDELRILEFIGEWRKEVRLALGALPHDLTPRFSGGATYGDTGQLTTIPDKMSSTPQLYKDSSWLSHFWWDTGWGRACARRRIAPTTVRGNVFFTVPKDSEKDRGCAKEASLAVSYQLAVAQTMRNGLKRGFDIDLRYQAVSHRELARWSSRTGTLATVDMSNASDTVSRVLVKLLLPSGWFTLLDSLRAHFTCVDGSWVRLEKFSSMGNGFTFELETIIFASLARTIVRLEGGDERRVTCFGDDVILPTEHYRGFAAALAYFGFTMNRKKSFSEGPFRESCGGDYFRGQLVRPHYLKEIPDEPQKWMALYNGLRRADPQGLYVGAALRTIKGFVPYAIRQCVGPSSLGDLVFHDDDPEPPAGAPVPKDPSHEVSRWFRCYRPVVQSLPLYHWHDDVALHAILCGVPSSGPVPRGAVSGYRVGWVLDPSYSTAFAGND